MIIMIKKLVYFSVFCNKARLKSLKITDLYEHVSMASKHDIIVLDIIAIAFGEIYYTVFTQSFFF